MRFSSPKVTWVGFSQKNVKVNQWQICISSAIGVVLVRSSVDGYLFTMQSDISCTISQKMRRGTLENPGKQNHSTFHPLPNPETTSNLNFRPSKTHHFAAIEITQLDRKIQWIAKIRHIVQTSERPGRSLEPSVSVGGTPKKISH